MLTVCTNSLRNGITIFRKNLNLAALKNELTFSHRRNFHQTSYLNRRFFEEYRRGTIPPELPEKPWHEHVKEGRKIFFQECKLFAQEVREHFRQDRKLYVHGDSDVFFRFDNEEVLKKWRIGSDKINDEGFSDCNFTINDKGKGVFSGNIDTTIPKDGKSRFAGYCGIKSTRKTKSFLREDWYNWDHFTHLEMKVKGDGRGYAINIGIAMYFDVTWFTTFTYPLYTRGGPYWETVRIPFSKFFLQSKGRIQDRQERIPLNRVNSIGITAATVPGPFHLELDYIGCHVDMNFKEECAYELYKIPKELVTD